MIAAQKHLAHEIVIEKCQFKTNKSNSSNDKKNVENCIISGSKTKNDLSILN